MHLVGIVDEYNPQQQVPTTSDASEFPIRHSLRSLALCAQCLLQYSVNSCHKTHCADSAVTAHCLRTVQSDDMCEQLNSHAELISKSLPVASGALFCHPNWTVSKP